MNKSPIAPWSQTDEETDDIQGISASGTSDQFDFQDSPWAAGSPRSTFAWGKLNITQSWAMVPLTASVIWLLWGAISVAKGAPGLSIPHILGISILILAAGALLVIARTLRLAGVKSFYHAIRRNDDRSRQMFDHLPIAAELRPIWDAVGQHAANIETRVAQLLDEHKHMSLEFSLADTQKRQIDAILQSLPDPLLVVDAFDQILLANPAAGSLFGFDAKQAIRKPLMEFVKDEKLVQTIRQAREADSRAANRRMECEIASRVYSVTMTPLATAGETASPSKTSDDGHGVVILFRDITKEFETAKKKSEFVAHAAHELRTPLSSIRAYVEMLVNGEAADEKTRREYLEIVQTSADRLGRMIDNILNISRIEAGTIRINKEPVALAVVVKEVIDVARPQAEQKHLTMTEELTPVIYRTMADRDLIYQAVLNLLSNAIKYTPEGGRVHVRMMPNETQRIIGIEVSDSGVGIPTSDLPHMFEKFFRVEATKNMAKGTGLGLNLVKHIVETIHEGKMTLVSESGKGSTFGMILPLCQ